MKNHIVKLSLSDALAVATLVVNVAASILQIVILARKISENPRIKGHAQACFPSGDLLSIIFFCL